MGKVGVNIMDKCNVMQWHHAGYMIIILNVSHWLQANAFCDSVRHVILELNWANIEIYCSITKAVEIFIYHSS